MSIRQDIEKDDFVFIGEDRTIRFTVRDEAGGVVVNITGWAIEFVLRKQVDSASAVLSKTVGSGITIPTGTDGQFTVAIADTDTVNLLPGRYSYATRRTDAGLESVLAHGDFELQLAAAK